MPRVALLFEYPTLSGGERSILSTVGLLRRSGHSLLALAPAGGRLASALAEQDIDHVAFSVAEDRGTAVARLEAALAAGRADLLHANSLAMGRLAGELALGGGPPTTAHLRDILNLSAAAITRLNANRRLLAVSRATRDHHVAQGLDPDRTLVVPNGIDTDLFARRPPTGRLRRELGLPPDRLLVATIGQVALRKGLDVLAAAAGQVDREVDYLVIGERYSDKPESVAFEREVFARFEQAGPRGRVHRLGYRDDIPGLLCEIDVLVHPAHQEPLGRVLLEAAACGRAILATDVGGTPEILSDGDSALLCPPGDPAALADGLRRLADDEPLRRRLGQRARQVVAERFTVTAAAEGLLEAWGQALGESVS